MMKRLLDMKRLFLALGALFLLSGGVAHAQVTTKVVGTCGTQSFTAGSMQYPTQDTTGAACGSGGGGGGGGAVTIADGANVTQGSIADPVVASGASGTVESYLRTIKDSAVSTTPSTVNITQVAGATVAQGHGTAATALRVELPTDGTGLVNVAQATAANLNAQVQGAAASGFSVSGNPLLSGCRAATAAPTAVTDGQAVAAFCGAEGKQIMLPYSIKELAVRGSTGATTGASQVSIIASAGGSLKNYITAIQCANIGATTSILTFTDAAATVLINPAGGGGSWTFPVPLATAAATAFQVTFGSASTSQYCSAQGYTGL